MTNELLCWEDDGGSVEIVKRATYNTFVQSVFCIQPMTRPVGNIFYFEYKYGIPKYICICA